MIALHLPENNTDSAAENAPPVPVVKIGRLKYQLPFATMFRTHTPQERSRLAQSIAISGIRVRIMTYTSPTLGARCVIDGATRLGIAAEYRISVPVHDLGQLSDEEARELALAINADRRHLTIEEQIAARAKRIDRVASAHEEGRSTRQIAKEEGVSQKQVMLDLARAKKSTPTQPRTPQLTIAAARKSLSQVRQSLAELAAGEWADLVKATADEYNAAAALEALDSLFADLVSK